MIAGLICIVDDNTDYRTFLGLLFRRYCPDHPTRFFADGQTFLEELGKLNQLPRLILLDRHMPGFDGHQVLTILKQHPVYKRVPVVMMSAGATDEEIIDCYESGANSFLRKDAWSASITTVCRYWLELNQGAVE
ncbi:response regulator [Spirosoma pomorum]